MGIEQNKQIAKISIEAIENIAAQAEKDFSETKGSTLSVFQNSFRNQAACISNAEREEQFAKARLLTCNSPIYGSVIVKDYQTEQERTFYFTKGVAPSFDDNTYTVANCRAPMASLLSQNIGDDYEVNTPSGEKDYLILQKNEFDPLKKTEGWDSSATFYFADTASKYPSLRELLNSSFLSFLTDETEENQNGKIKREIISSMGLREKHVLDKIQDKIYRSDANQKMILLGAPGTGKTTTLIKKLGLNLDIEYSTLNGDKSWYMFTPTDLLKNYLKEAFSREEIAAPDTNVFVWDNFRNKISRDYLNLLQTSVKSGFIKTNKNYIKNDCSATQRSLFEDFFGFQNTLFLTKIKEAYQEVIKLDNKKIQSLLKDIDILGEKKVISLCNSLEKISEKLDKNIKEIQKSIETKITHISQNFLFKGMNSDKAKSYLAELQQKIDTEYNIKDDVEETENDDEEVLISAKTMHEIYVKYILQPLQNLSYKSVLSKKVPPKSFDGIVSKYINFDEKISDSDKKEIGDLTKNIKLLKMLRRPTMRYFTSLKTRYKLYRKENKKKYITGFDNKNISNTEIDILILAYLKAYKGFHLNKLDEVMRGQIFVDEITDFSAVQLAIMNNLLKEGSNTFFGAGDLNQRLTTIGITEFDEIKWALGSNVVKEEIKIPYRQSKQLFELSQKIIDGDAETYDRPKYLDIEGLNPVLGYNLNNVKKLAKWLSERMIEIDQKLEGRLPSIAILVNHEKDIESLQKVLNDLLADKNISVDACLKGQILGSENNVRIFSIDYIKGLEFEAAFFINVDKLAEEKPDIFEKYLYVGISRAATFLGLTVQGNELPKKISKLDSLFVENWK